jgi:Family of unknown function (DUF6186)
MTRLITLLGYAVIVATAVGLELAARRRGDGTFGDALAAALRRWPVRMVVVAAWLWLGWHLFVRVDWR